MDDDLKVQAKNQDALHREMKRKALDTIRIYNPLEQDKTIIWDGFPHVVKAHQETSFPRYLAEKATYEIVVDLINNYTTEKIEEELKKRAKAGLKTFDNYEKNVEVIDRLPRTDNEELLRKYYPLVWLGVEAEYGMDYGGEVPDKTYDNRTVQERILEELERQRTAVPPAPAKESTPEIKKELEKEVTNDQG
jgi:hypothetical protein